MLTDWAWAKKGSGERASIRRKKNPSNLDKYSICMCFLYENKRGEKNEQKNTMKKSWKKKFSINRMLLESIELS